MQRTDCYEINVAKKRNRDDKYGIHYCRIELPETSLEEAKKKSAEIEKIFNLYGNDFVVSLTFWKCRGEVVEYHEPEQGFMSPPYEGFDDEPFVK